MKRSERACVIIETLVQHPNRDYSLGYFAELFDCAKSSISEDLHVVRSAVNTAGYGYIETTAGAKGGVRFVPYIDNSKAIEVLESLKKELEKEDRQIGGGFLYTSDLMFNPDYIKACAMLFAKKFAACEADFIVTVETRGIGVAMLTAELLHRPLVVLGRETRVADGSTVSINYFAGSTDRIQKMSVSKRAIKPGEKAIIIDDFMRQGGSIKGIENMLKEFNAVPVGTGVVMVANGIENKKVGDFYPLIIMDQTQGGLSVKINPEIK